MGSDEEGIETGVAPPHWPPSPMCSRRAIRPALVLMVAALGCAPSVLVRPDDAMFAGAQEHIAIVGAMLEKSEAEPDEKQRFAQAEAFYEYRFTFPEREARAASWPRRPPL